MAILPGQAALKEYFETTLAAFVPPDIQHRFAGNRHAQVNIVLGQNALLLDSYVRDATEVDVDAISDGEQVFIAGVMEHIEEAGVHSGDSACSLPPHSLSEETMRELERQTKDIARALNVIGLMNIQFAVKGDEVYVLEVNPRASRTVPFVSKVIGHPVAAIAARVMAGEKLSAFNLAPREIGHVGVKEAVFPFERFPEIDPVLGPEMRSTGEVMGIDRSYAVAFAKSQLASGSRVPTSGTLFVSVKEADKARIVQPVKELAEMGFKVLATRGTLRHLKEHGVACTR